MLLKVRQTLTLTDIPHRRHESFPANPSARFLRKGLGCETSETSRNRTPEQRLQVAESGHLSVSRSAGTASIPVECGQNPLTPHMVSSRNGILPNPTSVEASPQPGRCSAETVESSQSGMHQRKQDRQASVNQTPRKPMKSPLVARALLSGW